MPLSSTALQKLAELEATHSAPAVDAEIRRLLETGRDVDLYKLNAHRLAKVAGVPVVDALRTLLFATRLGIFDLNYDIYCPECRGNTEYDKHLMGLKAGSHCNLCQVDFDVGFLDSVEVTFTVNPSVRTLAFEDFSARDRAGKLEWFEQVAARNGRTPLTRALFEGPGSTGVMTADLAAGTYAVYVPLAHEHHASLVVEGEPTSEVQRAEIVADETGRISPPTLTMRPGPIEIVATSQFPRPWWPILVLPAGEPPMWLSASFVTSQQDFRDLFSGEFLAPGVTFAVRSATLMFTDIRSSTEMFEELGDSAAYALVQDHFTTMTRLIREHRGGIVKTIGDAVMAAFPSNVDAVEAALAIQRTFHADPIRGRRLELKIGLHRGPTIAVTSNRNLDYFGRTVNMAARVQGSSRPGEVVMSDDVASDVAVASSLAGVEREVTYGALKGIGEGFRLHRVRVAT